MRRRVAINMKSQKYSTLESKRQKQKSCCCGLRPWQICCLSFLIFIAVVLAGAGIAIGIYSTLGPLHASCKATWTVNADCDNVNSIIVDQILKWKGPDGCKNGGQRCLYYLKSNTSDEIVGIHETPVKHYKDDFSFKFSASETSNCTIEGYSSSQVWYAVLDYGTNFCNLKNLLTGAGIDHMPEFSEETSNRQCTQYSSADCDKY